MAEMNKDTATLLQEMIDVKKSIRTSISNKGVDVVGGMMTYPDAIDRISGITGVDSDIDYTQIGWTLNNSNEQNEIDAQYINKGLEYTKTLMDKGDVSKWTDNSPFIGDEKLVFAPFIYNIGDKEINSMFEYCASLRAVPFFDTSNVTDMRSMFSSCHSLMSIPQLNTSNVTDMEHMFSYCYSLTSIPQLDTSNVTNMHYMFYQCLSLITIPQLDTSNVTDMRSMFSSCYSLTTIPQLDTSNVTDMQYMFDSCMALETIPLLNTSNVTCMSFMFEDCKKLTTIPLLNTSNVTSMYRMFSGCTSLTAIPQLDTSNVTDMSQMFQDCEKLETVPLLDATNLYRSPDDPYNEMFRGCKKLKNFGGLKGLKYSLNLRYCTELTYESLMNVINNLGEAINSSTQLTISFVSREKLSDDDIAIATNKGWTIATGYHN